MSRCWQSGLNAQITVLHLAAATSVLFHRGQLQSETLRLLFCGASLHRWHLSQERQEKGGMLPAVLRHVTKLVTVFDFCTCASQLSSLCKFAQSAASSMLSYWPRDISVFPPVAPALGRSEPAHLVSIPLDKRETEISLVHPRLTFPCQHLCFWHSFIWFCDKFGKFRFALLFCFLKRSNFSFSELTLSSFSSHLLNCILETIKGYII